MSYSVTVKVPPQVEPVSIDEAKKNSEIDAGLAVHDDYLARLIRAARVHTENYTRRALITQTLELRLDRFPTHSVIALPHPPLASVTSINYIDGQGNPATLDPSVYQWDPFAEPGRLGLKNGQSWPDTADWTFNTVTIEYVAGVDLAVLSDDYRHAILLLVSHWFENREASVPGSKPNLIPLGYDSLMFPNIAS